MTATHRYAAHTTEGAMVYVPDQVAQDQRAYDGQTILVHDRDGLAHAARLRGDLYGLHTPGTGDPIVELLPVEWLDGADAIAYAVQHDRPLSSYQDPTAPARDDLTPDEARVLAHDDPALVYLPGIVRCACGQATGVGCAWVGPVTETVTVEWMPPHLRASHAAAGSSGTWPHNGSVRLQVSVACAQDLADERVPADKEN